MSDGIKRFSRSSTLAASKFNFDKPEVALRENKVDLNGF